MFPDNIVIGSHYPIPSVLIMTTTETTSNSSIDELFQKAQKDIFTLSKPPSDENKLKLYGLFKQATQGDCNEKQPSRFNFVKYYKWKAWNDLKGVSKEDAKLRYIKLVSELTGIKIENEQIKSKL